MSVNLGVRLLDLHPDQIARTRTAPGGDILRGAAQIALFLFDDPRDRRRVYYLVEMRRMPVFRLGSTICARKSTLMKWFAEQEASSLGGGA